MLNTILKSAILLIGVSMAAASYAGGCWSPDVVEDPNGGYKAIIVQDGGTAGTAKDSETVGTYQTKREARMEARRAAKLKNKSSEDNESTDDDGDACIDWSVPDDIDR